VLVDVTVVRVNSLLVLAVNALNLTLVMRVDFPVVLVNPPLVLAVDLVDLPLQFALNAPLRFSHSSVDLTVADHRDLLLERALLVTDRPPAGLLVIGFDAWASETALTLLLSSRTWTRTCS
jgi:hypothetical protein